MGVVKKIFIIFTEEHPQNLLVNKTTATVPALKREKFALHHHYSSLTEKRGIKRVCGVPKAVNTDIYKMTDSPKPTTFK